MKSQWACSREELTSLQALVWQERVPRERRQRWSVLHKKPQAEDWRTARETCKGTGDNEQTSCQVSWMLKACLERRKVPRLGFADHSKTVKPEGRVGPSFPYSLVETVLQKESSSTD
ncbi:PHD finger protein 14 [Plecturocebus cupreus]